RPAGAGRPGQGRRWPGRGEDARLRERGDAGMAGTCAWLFPPGCAVRRGRRWKRHAPRATAADKPDKRECLVRLTAQSRRGTAMHRPALAHAAMSRTVVDE